MARTSPVTAGAKGPVVVNVTQRLVDLAAELGLDNGRRGFEPVHLSSARLAGGRVLRVPG